MVAFASVVLMTALFAPSVQAERNDTRRCATLSNLALTRAAEDRDAIQMEQTRPESVGFIDSEAYPVRLHWQVEEFAPRADAVLPLIEAAWAEQVTLQGYREPRADMGEGGDTRLDVYLVNTPGIAGLTIASGDIDAEDGAHSAYVHMLLNATLSDEELSVTVPHEFAHALHFATDRSESLMFFEASATWQEVHAVPTSTLWIDNIEAFQTFPNAPVYTDGIDWRDVAFEDVLYEYGAVLFVMYLEEELGDDDGLLLRALWEASVQGDDVEDNEPDWMDALKDQPAFDGAETFTEFAAWRTFVGTWRAPGEGPRLAEALGGQTEVAARRLLPAALQGLPLNFLAYERPFATGCTWVSTTAPGNRAVEVEIEATSDGRLFSLVGFQGTPPGEIERIELPSEPQASFLATVTLGEGESLRIGACDVASEFDGDSIGEPMPLSLSLFDTSLPRPEMDAGVAEPDATPDVDGGAPDPEPPLVCGCQTSRRAPLPGGGPWGALKPYFYVGGILAAAYMFFVRFRRSARARKSMKGSNWKAQRDAVVKKGGDANTDEANGT